MLDPRIVEIEFLMELEDAGTCIVRSTLATSSSFVQFGQRQTLLNLDALRFRDLAVGLMMAGSIVGLKARSDSGGIDEDKLRAERQELMTLLTAGHAVHLALSHAGRVRLWNQRDALLRDADLEPMGLKNKAAWDRDMALRLIWARPEAPLSIVFFDLDKFKVVNDTKGHRIGDLVLRAAFDLAKNHVGSRGSVYRFGGEEVGVLLPGLSHETAVTLAEELRLAFESSIGVTVPELGGTQTASFGVSTYSQRVQADEAFDFVNALEKEAKDTGRNRVIARPFAKK